jgi:type IV secretory pathway VirD2 relaxase
MADDEFELWLGRAGHDRPLAHRLRKAVNLAGGIKRVGNTRSRRFDGSRIGRGSGIGRVLSSSDRYAGARARRVVVKARFAKLAGKGIAAVAHLRYLQRDGTTREGGRGSLYGADRDAVDGKAFLDRGSGDRHQFRFIVAPEDGAQYEDLKPLVRRWMKQVEVDLGTRLDWVAVDHFNTGHPHSHVLVRGIDERGQNLIIAREYMSRGLAMRATELVNLDLGPRTDREILEASRREIDQERFTGIDRTLLRARDADGFVTAWHPDSIEQSLRAGRLGTLARMGLAIEEERGRYRLDAGLEPTLREMGRRGDIIALMHEQMKRDATGVQPQDYAIYDPTRGEPLIGRVVTRGLADEHSDRMYAIIAAIDGRSHYVELGEGVFSSTPEPSGIVRVNPAVVALRPADRVIAKVAASNGGIYSVEQHLLHDPTATRRFAEAHVRRLEAMRRAGAGVERQQDGSWTIAPDHLDRALGFEHAAFAAKPVSIDALSTEPLAHLASRDGATWLDEQLVAPVPEKLGSGFGAEVRKALALRQQWLIEQGLASREGEGVQLPTGLIAELRQRELRQVAAQLSRELGLDFVEHRGGRVEGIYRKPVQIGSARFAVIEKSREFTLVPWRPVLEKQLGRPVSGIDRAGSISWTFGRGRAGPEVGSL